MAPVDPYNRMLASCLVELWKEEEEVWPYLRDMPLRCGL